MKKNQPTPGVDRGTLERQRSAVPLSYVDIGVQHVENMNFIFSINSKTSDNSVG